MQKSVRDIVIQIVGQAAVQALVRASIISPEMQGEATIAAIAIMPALYRALRAMPNPVGAFLRSMDEPTSTPN